jgi:membrane fusion protein
LCMSDPSLFRPEAVAQQHAKWSGHAIIAVGLPTSVIVGIVTGLLLLLILFLVWGSYTQRLHVAAEVITDPHTIQLFSQQQGIIAKQYTSAPTRVALGQNLYRIDVSRTTHSGNVSAHVRSALTQQIAQVHGMMQRLKEEQMTHLAHDDVQLRQLQQAYQQTHQQVQNNRYAMETMRKTMRDYAQYLAQGLVTKTQLSQQQAQFYQQQNSYQQLQTFYQQQGIEIEKLVAEQEHRRVAMAQSLSQLVNQESDLQSQLIQADASGDVMVVSPVAGQLVVMSVTTGQMVHVGDALAQIVPTADDVYQLVLWVPNSALPYVGVHDDIKIRYDAFPFAKFGQFSGQIIALANVPSTLEERAHYVNAPKDDQPYYKAIAKIHVKSIRYQDKALLLATGMKAQVTLFLEARPLYQWILAPLYDAGKGVGGAHG